MERVSESVAAALAESNRKAQEQIAELSARLDGIRDELVRANKPDLDMVLSDFRGSIQQELNRLSSNHKDQVSAVAANMDAAIKRTEEQLRSDLPGMIDARVAEIPVPKDGKDAEPVDVESLRKSLAAEAREIIAAIPIPENGKDGKDGRDGKDADPIDPAVIHNQITQAAIEFFKTVELPKDGRDGRDGRDGKDGLPGRDALELDILPAIDLDKSYPPGTYAAHRGGLWKSQGTTDGLNNWLCFYRGINNAGMRLDSEKTIHCWVELSDKPGESTDIRLPFITDRGVYNNETKYLDGDAVSWDGSLWIAQRDEPTGKPGSTSDWRLAVKKGRDGKDGKDGRDGKDGKPPVKKYNGVE